MCISFNMTSGVRVVFSTTKFLRHVDRDAVLKYLIPGNEYIIEEIDVGAFRTDLTIEGFDGTFSHIFFEVVKNEGFYIRRDTIPIGGERCPACDDGIMVNADPNVLMCSEPPQIRVQCPECEYITYRPA